MNVLIIDPDDALRVVLAAMVTASGRTAWPVARIAEALRASSDTIVDVLITDIQLPLHEGLDSIERLREAFPGLKILALVGGGTAEVEEIERARSALAPAITLPQPVVLRDLQRALDRLDAAGSSSFH